MNDLERYHIGLAAKPSHAEPQYDPWLSPIGPIGPGATVYVSRFSSMRATVLAHTTIPGVFITDHTVNKTEPVLVTREQVYLPR